MVKRTLDIYECDTCGKPATRYSIGFPEGTLVVDRCETHGKKFEGLRTEKGEWVNPRGPKASFRKSSPEDLRAALRAADGGGG